MSQAGIAASGLVPPPVGVVETLTGNVGGAVGPAGNNINVIGSGGITVTGNPLANTLTITGGGGMTWNRVAVNTNMVASNGYITNNVAGITLNLPASGTLGDTISVTQLLGAWTIQCGAGQDIIYGSADSSVGGSLVSLNIGDAVTLVCITPGIVNSTWMAISSMGGLITVN